MLYWVLPAFLFWIAMPVISITAVLLAFVTINGVPVINTIFSSLGFLTGTKNYTWKKKESPYPFKTIKRAPIKKIEDGSVLSAQQSRLRKTRTAVELRTK